MLVMSSHAIHDDVLILHAVTYVYDYVLIAGLGFAKKKLCTAW